MNFRWLLPMMLFLVTCGDDFATFPVRAPWLLERNDLERSLSLVRRGSHVDGVVWSGFDLDLIQSQSILSNNQKLVMVSVGAGSLYEESLKADLRTILYRPSDFHQTGYYLLALNNWAELNTLAGHAHNTLHSCGSLELITPNQSLALDLSMTRHSPMISDGVTSQSVSNMLKTVDEDSLKKNIKALSDLGSRHHASVGGLQAPTKVMQMFDAVKGSLAIQSEQISNDISAQKSVVVRIKGSKYPNEIVILGAHLDSITTVSANNSSDAPGADDDASGIATLVEAFRAFARSGASFQRTIEFHVYAAEEIGLIGSAALARSYAAKNRDVVSMLQIDMNAYHQDPESRTIYLVNTFTSGLLTRSLKNLLRGYLGGDYSEKELKSGSSDHKSWTQAGFMAAFPFEDPDNYNRKLHTNQDTYASLNNTALTKRFTQLAIAYLSHYAGLEAAVSDTEGLNAFENITDDIKIGLTQDAASNLWNIAVVGSTEVTRMEYCTIAEKASISCSSELSTFEALSHKKDRSRFATKEPLDLEPGNLRIFAYDKDDNLIEVRHVGLIKNS